MGKGRDADRPSSIARRVHQRRGPVGLAGWNAVVRCGDDRQEDQRRFHDEQHPRAREEPEVELAVHGGQIVHGERDDHPPATIRCFGWCPYQKSRPGWRRCSDGLPSAGMLDLLKLLGGFAVGLFRLQAAREAEMAFLRQQLLVLRRSAPARLRLRIADRLIFVWLYRLFPSLLGAAVIFQPETLVRWHRSGFRLYWRWKSGRRVGRPAIPAEIRNLVRAVSRDNPALGCTTNSWRVAETRYRHRPINRRQVHASASPPAFSGLAGLPAQSHCPHRSH